MDLTTPDTTITTIQDIHSFFGNHGLHVKYREELGTIYIMVITKKSWWFWFWTWPKILKEWESRVAVTLMYDFFKKVRKYA
jgi:hypothetical protein